MVNWSLKDLEEDNLPNSTHIYIQESHMHSKYMSMKIPERRNEF